MGRRDLKGRYIRNDPAFLGEKANRAHDPRNIFYRAMLDCDTYEAYEAAVGNLAVSPRSRDPLPGRGRCSTGVRDG